MVADAPVGLLTTTADGLIVEVNQTFCAWTLRAREELVTEQRFQDLLSAPGRVYHETHFAPLLHMQDEVSEVALELVIGDGTRLPVLVNARLSRDADGRPDTVRLAVFRALDRRRYERELLSAQRRERAARDRTERLQRLTSRLAAAADVATIGELLSAEMIDAGLSEPAVRIAESVRSAPRDRTVIALSSGERPVGVAWGTGELTDDDRVHLHACATQCALALERAQLYERERTVAHVLQASLLEGAAPEDPRCRVQSHYRPGTGGLEVGGDFYDSFFIHENRLGLVVGDVVGHGLTAATAMGQLRSALRAVALIESGPARVLERLHAFVATVPAAEGTTVVYVEADLDDRTARYACAGHPPPLLVEDGRARFLEGGRSTPLGYLPPAERPEAAIDLREGSRVLLYTDGLVENRREPIDAGLARLAAAACGAPPPTPHELTDELVGGSSVDDVCVLAFEMLMQA